MTKRQPSAAEIIASKWEYFAHYNMGRAGYGYGHRCMDFPRLTIIDRDYRKSKEYPDGKLDRQWLVDGNVLETTPARAFVPATVLTALAVAPVLTDDERRILDLVPDEFAYLRDLEDGLAGVERPSGGIMPDTPHSRVLRWLEALQSKGMIEYGRREWPKDYRPDYLITHHRWDPVVRRRKQEPTEE